MAPSTPRSTRVAMARRSSRLETPPEAITGASVRSVTLASSSRFGPFSVPSFVTSVTTNREHPSRSRRSSTSHRSPPSVSQPRPRSRNPPPGEEGSIFTSRPTATRSPCSVTTSAHHCGFSRAAVPRLTLAQPVASAAARDSSSRMPPDNSTATSSLPTTSASSARLDPRPNAASRSTRWIHSAPSRCQVIAASSAEPYSVSLPAWPCTSRTAVPSTTSTAGKRISCTAVNLASSQGRYPIAQQCRARVAALLGAKLGGRERTVLDGRQERHVVGCPGQQCCGVAFPYLRGVRVHKIEPGGGVESLEQRAACRGVDDVPAHVRNHRSIEPDDRAGPLTAALRLDAEFHAAGEQDLHAHAHSEHRQACGDPLGDDLVAADLAQAGHACLVCTDAWHHQPVGARGRIGVCGHLDVGTHPFQRALRRPKVARAVVEYHNGFRRHRLPSVDGTPVTRGSYSTA